MVRVMANIAFVITADWLPDGGIFVWKSQAGTIGISVHFAQGQKDERCNCNCKSKANARSRSNEL